MAHGNQTAKLTLYDDVEELADKLADGGDTKLQGQAIAKILRILKPLFLADLVTEERLDEALQEHCKECSAHSRRPFSWPACAALLGSVGMVVGMVIKLWG